MSKEYIQKIKLDTRNKEHKITQITQKTKASRTQLKTGTMFTERVRVLQCFKTTAVLLIQYQIQGRRKWNGKL